MVDWLLVSLYCLLLTLSSSYKFYICTNITLCFVCLPVCMQQLPSSLFQCACSMTVNYCVNDNTKLFTLDSKSSSCHHCRILLACFDSWWILWPDHSTNYFKSHKASMNNRLLKVTVDLGMAVIHPRVTNSPTVKWKELLLTPTAHCFQSEVSH